MGVEVAAAAPVPSRHFIAVCLVLNIFLSIGIVFINKILYVHYHFPNLTLTCMHFVATSIGMQVCRMANVFVAKSLPLSQMIPISLSFCGFVLFTNLSLQFNTVGTYQIIKTMTMPCIIGLQTIVYQRTFSLPVKITTIPIFVGVTLNSWFDVKFSLVGSAFAAVGVLVTSLYQVWVAEKQKELTASSTQLLYYQAPLSALGVALLVPFFEPVTAAGGILGYVWTAEALGFVIASCSFAFAINLTIFWIIGNTSPLTYNMVGHLKFCLTLVGGLIIFKDPVQLLQVVGIVCTFSGVLAYSYFKTIEQNQSKKVTSRQQEDEQEKGLLYNNESNVNMSKLEKEIAGAKAETSG